MIKRSIAAFAEAARLLFFHLCVEMGGLQVAFASITDLSDGFGKSAALSSGVRQIQAQPWRSKDQTKPVT